MAVTADYVAESMLMEGEEPVLHFAFRSGSVEPPAETSAMFKVSVGVKKQCPSA